MYIMDRQSPDVTATDNHPNNYPPSDGERHTKVYRRSPDVIATNNYPASDGERYTRVTIMSRVIVGVREYESRYFCTHTHLHIHTRTPTPQT